MQESQFYTPYEQDVPYGMHQEEIPQPMGNSGLGMQGYPSFGSQNSNVNPMPLQTYAKGGRVSLNSLRKAVEKIREQGFGDDKILAHINPQEAMELSMLHGGDINPISGLPQFGWWERMWEGDNGNGGILGAGHSVAEVVAPIFRDVVAPTLGSAAGMMLGGPFGSVLGGSLASGGVEAANAENPRLGRALLRGALHGAVQGVGAPMLGRSFGIAPAGRLGTLLGMGAAKHMLFPGAVAALGLKSAAAPAVAAGSAGRAAAFEALKNAGAKAATPSAGKGLLGLFGGAASKEGEGLLGGNLLNKGLLGAAILGGLGAKYETPKEKSSAEYMAEHGPKWGPEHHPRELNPYERSLRYFDPNNYNPGFVPEMMYFSGPGYDRPLRMAEGGHLFQGHESGQSDTLDRDLPEGGYVIDASTVSDLGDGNTEAGINKIKGLHHFTSGKHYKKGGVPRGTIKAKVSAGEAFISPEEVTAIGKGNNMKGASMLKNMVNNIRKHKRSNTKGLPPKAKPIAQYLRSR